MRPITDSNVAAALSGFGLSRNKRERERTRKGGGGRSPNKHQEKGQMEECVGLRGFRRLTPESD